MRTDALLPTGHRFRLLIDAAGALRTHEPSRLVVDVSQVSYVDSSGLAVLVNAMRDVEDYGGLFMLAGVQEDVRAILESARLEKFFLIFRPWKRLLPRLKSHVASYTASPAFLIRR